MHQNTKLLITFAILSCTILFTGVVFGWVDPGSGPAGGFGAFKPNTEDATKFGIALNIGEEPLNSLSIGGALGVGISYVNTIANGNDLLVEGNVAIGRPTAIAKLSVNGGIALEGISQRFFPNTKLPTSNIYYRLPNPDEVISGGYLALTIGRDGMPVFVFVDDGRIKVGHCRVPDCSTEASLANLDVAQGAGYVSIAIGSNGYPIIAGIKSGPKLVFYACQDYECKSSIARELDIDTSKVLSLPTSITTQSNGFPIIAYRKDLAGNGGNYLMFSRCLDVSCGNTVNQGIMSGNTIITGDPDSIRSQIALGSDGFPFSTFLFDSGLVDGKGLYFRKCTNMNCSGIAGSKLVSNTGEFASVTVGSDGFPLITFYDGIDGDLKLISCRDVNCSASQIVISTVESTGDVGKYSSITTSIDGLPLIAYHNRTTVPQSLNVRKCGNKECTISHGVPISLNATVPGATNAGKFASIGLGVDGLPVVTFLQTINGQETMYFLKCGSENCLPYWSRR